MEKNVLAIGMYGDGDFFNLKGVVENVLEELGITKAKYQRESDNSSFHPGRTAKLILNNYEIGIIGEIHVDVASNYNIKDRVYIAQIDFDKIVELTNLEIKYTSLPKYPTMIRDLAVVVKEDVLVGDIKKLISKHGKGLIEKIEIFDIYTGDQISEGMKSVAFSIIYRSPDRTLREDEVNNIQNDIVKDLGDVFDAKLRS